MPPRRRSTGIVRKPRVAGLVPARLGAHPPPAAGPDPDEVPAAGGWPRPAAASRDAAGGPVVAALAPPVAEADPQPEPVVVDPAPPVAGDDLRPEPGVVGEPVPPVAGVSPQPHPEQPHPEPPTVDYHPIPAPAAIPASARRGRIAALRARPVAVLAVALAVFGVLAAGFGVADAVVRGGGSAANTALADVGATSDVVNQLGAALETVYSYDFTQLDANERAAREVITPEFAVKFEQLFTQVRELAPQQQAVVSAAVTASAVQSIEGERAVLVAFLDQQATRANAGAEPQQLTAAGRLTVVGELVDGTWKIADVTNH
ncbi:MAG: hypothetical protein ACT4RN_18340 [Pseudonocardia sp.]